MKGGREHRLRVRQKACNACMSCQIYCVMAKEHICAPRRARVQVELDPFGARHRIHLCRQCKQAACAEACPEGAIALSEDGSYWAIDYARCTLCRECVEACPLDALFYDPVGERVIKCDLCQGDPLCAQVCPTGALTWDGQQRE